MGQIEDDVHTTLQAAGLQAKVVTQLAPAWTTDWMTDIAKEKLRAYGIAPPGQHCAKGREAGESVLRFVRSAAEPAPAVPWCPPGQAKDAAGKCVAARPAAEAPAALADAEAVRSFLARRIAAGTLTGVYEYAGMATLQNRAGEFLNGYTLAYRALYAHEI